MEYNRSMESKGVYGVAENEALESYEQDILTLTDEDGEEFRFEVIDAADYNDEHYLAVVPFEEDPAKQLEEDAELVIMRVGDEDGEEYLDVVEDEEELAAVSEMFANRLEELYDIRLDE
ncbi:MAG: DUF1292 domain-containing protein [Butyricicoccus sp.]|nr:DUF1292 domain-containing protein [Butyricicoccus sp.]